MSSKPKKFLCCTAYNPIGRPARDGAVGPCASVWSDLKWHKEKIYVHFSYEVGTNPYTWELKNGKPAITHLDVLRLANVWKRDKGSGVPLFEETTNMERSDIRLVFSNAAASSSSCVGTDAVRYKGYRTMVLNLNGEDDSYKESTIVHEFGHALGFAHEHQTKHLVGILDEDVTIDWLKNTCGLSPEAAKEKYERDYAILSGTDDDEKLDVHSIMCYPIDKKCIKAEFLVPTPRLSAEQLAFLTCMEFSERKTPSYMDFAAARKMYPGPVPLWVEQDHVSYDFFCEFPTCTEAPGLKIEDLGYVLRVIHTTGVVSRWKGIATLLNINIDGFGNDEDEYDLYLFKAIALWLNGSTTLCDPPSCTALCDPPSWCRVLWAIADVTGGNAKEKAKNVAKEFKVGPFTPTTKLTAYLTDPAYTGPLLDRYDYVKLLGYLNGVLYEVRDRWIHIGILLGVVYHQLMRIKKKDESQRLRETLTEWLNNGRVVTLQRLVEAVEHSAGGNSPAKAKEVMDKYGV